MLEVEMSRMKSAEMEVRRLRKECVTSIEHECDKCFSDVTCKASLSKCHKEVNLKKSDSNDNDKPLVSKSAATETCQTIVLEGCQAAHNSCHEICNATSSRANKTCWSFEVAVRAQRDLERRLKWVHETDTFLNNDLFQIHAITFDAALASEISDQVSIETKMEVTVFGKKHTLKGLMLSFHEFAKLASEIAKQAVDWYQKSQPHTTTRHPDNRPRSSPS